MIQRVSYSPAIELFSRAHIKGWDCWGDDKGINEGHNNEDSAESS